MYPIVSVVGHVDVGKTSFLDFMTVSKTREVGNITQEVRVIDIDSNSIVNKIDSESFTKNWNLDGILFIDTPGHDYFEFMRQSTTSISNLVVLIIDVIDGLTQTHIQILKHLKSKYIDFIVLLNKIDRIEGWKLKQNSSLKQSFELQNKTTMKHLQDYMNNIVCQLAQEEINATPYYSNTDYKTYVSMVPISVKHGVGMSDCLLLLSKLLNKKMTNLSKIEEYGHIYGYIIDKNKSYKYIGNELPASFMVREQTITPKQVFKVSTHVYNIILDEDLLCGDVLTKQQIDINKLKDANLINQDSFSETQDDSLEIEEEITLNKHGIGIITPQKSMEKPLMFMFNQNKTPVNLISNTLNKTFLIKLSNNNKSKDKLQDLKNNEYRCVCIFDPTKMYQLTDELEEFAQSNNIKVIIEQTIYKLKEKYNEYINSLNQSIINKYGHYKHVEVAILPQFVFMKTSPLLLGVRVLSGELRMNTILEGKKDNKKIILGKVISIEKEKKPLTTAKPKDEVCIRIEAMTNKVEWKKDFDETFKVSTHIPEQDTKLYQLYKSVIDS